MSATTTTFASPSWQRDYVTGFMSQSDSGTIDAQMLAILHSRDESSAASRPIEGLEANRKNSDLQTRKTRDSTPKPAQEKRKLSSNSPQFGVQVIRNSNRELDTINKLQIPPQLENLMQQLPTSFDHREHDHDTDHDAGEEPHDIASPPSHDDDHDYDLKYKTEVCRNFQLTGTCKFGERCSFAHGDHELRNKRHINLHYKSKKCNQFFEQGFCPYGSRCQYLHTEDSFAHIFHSYCEKLLVWKERNPKLDMSAIMKKTHSFISRLQVFEQMELKASSRPSKDDRRSVPSEQQPRV